MPIKPGNRILETLSESDIGRFNSKVDKSGQCWLWTDVPAGNGYGYLGVGGRKGRKIQSHQIAYAIHRGDIPEGLQVDHLCRNRRCVNPDHLEAVTQKVNILRGDTISAKNKSKTQCMRGHAFTKENTRVFNGSRQCIACQNAWKKEHRRKNNAHP